MVKVDLQFPAGFKFYPTDDELVSHYLVRKCASQSIPVLIIADIDLYKFDPWDLPDKALYGEKEWYFFSPRDRKYPNGSRPNRSAGSGYWKATGADKPIGKPKPIGIKKALVFYTGKAPRGDKTNWIMHEYRLANVDRSYRKNSLRLDDWVLCRIYNKKGIIEKQRQQPSQSSIDAEEKKPQPLLGFSGYLPSVPATLQDDYVHFDSSESAPKLHPDSICSEHAASPEFSREVQSEPKSRNSWEEFCGFPVNGDAGMDFGGTASHRQLTEDTDEMSPLQDILLYLQKPF